MRNPQSIVKDEIRFLAPSLDAKIWHGHWKVVGNAKPDLSKIPFPPFKVAMDTADNFHIISYDGRRHRPATPLEAAKVPLRTTVAPVRLEHALQAAHGVRSWSPDYDRLDYQEAVRRANDVEL